MKKYHTNLTAKKLIELEKIAMNASYTLNERGGIDIRNRDREDFPEIEIESIQIMLEEAYRLGLKDGKKQFDIGNPKRYNHRGGAENG